MKEIQKNNLRLFFSTFLIICAFFCGYLFAQREIHLQKNDITSYYIDVSSSSRGISIKNMPENIYFRVDGELIQTGSIDLK